MSDGYTSDVTFVADQISPSTGPKGEISSTKSTIELADVIDKYELDLHVLRISVTITCCLPRCSPKKPFFSSLLVCNNVSGLVCVD